MRSGGFSATIDLLSKVWSGGLKLPWRMGWPGPLTGINKITNNHVVVKQVELIATVNQAPAAICIFVYNQLLHKQFQGNSYFFYNFVIYFMF